MHEARETDYSEIRDLINLYGLAIDTGNWDWFDNIFTGDVVADFPAKKWIGLRQWKLDFEAAHRPYVTTQHIMSIMRIGVEGTVAKAFTYGQWFLSREKAGGWPAEWRGQGWYQDDCVRTAQGWRISKRVNRIVAFDTAHPTPGFSVSSLKEEYRSGGAGLLHQIAPKSEK